MWIQVKSNFRKKMPAIRNIGVKTAMDAEQILLLAGESFIVHARAGCPKRSHRLEESIGSKTDDGVYERMAAGRGIRIGTKVPYARAVNEGIQTPYTIESRKGKVLRFMGTEGKPVFRKQVSRLPTTGRFFMNLAVIMMIRDIPSIIRKVKSMR